MMSATSPHQTHCVGAINLKAVSLEDVLQAVERQIIGVLGGHDIRQQARTGQALVDGLRGFVRHGDVGILGVLFALFAGVFEAHVLDPLEAAGDVLDLPACFLADSFPRLAAAWTGLLIVGKIVFLAGDRQLIEGRQVPPAPANAPDGFRFRFGERCSG